MERLLPTLGLALALMYVPNGARADESGVSFWLPGQFGSLAATPAEPGWAMPMVAYHYSADAGGDKDFAIGGRITAGLDAGANFLFVVPTYTFTKQFLGAQAALSMPGLYGRLEVDVEATLSGPNGNVLSRNTGDSITKGGDLYPTGTLRWNHGNHNTMAYTMVGVPVGSYEVGRLANIGTNHWSWDAGGGYTYLNQENGREFSAVAGLTYSFENPDTDYKNGESIHVDMGASQFLSKHWHVGLVGFWYQQVTGDSGDGAVLGDFESRVGGIGPQVGYLFNLGERHAYLNLKGYTEFDAQHRPEGWSGWITLLIPIGSPKKQ